MLHDIDWENGVEGPNVYPASVDLRFRYQEGAAGVDLWSQPQTNLPIDAVALQANYNKSIERQARVCFCARDSFLRECDHIFTKMQC
jgi:hypothetical protein